MGACLRMPAPGLALLILPLSLPLAGCADPRHVGWAKPPASADTTPGPSTDIAAAPVPPASEPAPAATPAPRRPPAEVSHGEILGKRTQDIRPAAPEEAKRAQVAGTRITARDPITLPGNAYVTIIGRIVDAAISSTRWTCTRRRTIATRRITRSS